MSTIEARYPISFRASEARELGSHLTDHNSVVMIGMKRVGISNFLRFFIYHPKIESTYIQNGLHHLFIPVDLNDLVERSAYPFRTLVLKRIVDTVQLSGLSPAIKKFGERYFSESIQLKDIFFTLDSVQKLLGLIVGQHMYPTLFLIRFDRLKDVITSEFFGNLQGLKDAVQQKMSYVFTSFRPLYELAPDVFQKSALSVFAHELYISPATAKDMHIILHTFVKRYHVTLPKRVSQILVELSGGHVQYLQLALIRLARMKHIPENKHELMRLLLADEEIKLQSEELFESLTAKEKLLLSNCARGVSFSHIDGAYLSRTGMITATDRLFSPLFGAYVLTQDRPFVTDAEFTKKEHSLFSLLKKYEGAVCEREDIIEAVWPEYAEIGVSDWAIDRLVARVRAKLKAQKSVYRITTIITRGYKLISES